MRTLRTGYLSQQSIRVICRLLLSLTLCLGNPATSYAQVDPATIAAIGSALLSLLPSPESEQAAQTQAQLAAIESQLEDMNSKLTSIQSQLSAISVALSALSVHIDQDFDAEARIRVAAEIQNVANHWDGWSKKADPQWQAEAEQALLQLQVDTDNLFVRQSFGSYETAGLSLYMQRNLMKLLGTDAVTRANIYKSFDHYFGDASDASVSGSLAAALAQQQATAASLLPQFAAGQNFVCPVSEVLAQCCGINHVCHYETFQSVAGDVGQPFTLVGQPDTRTLSNVWAEFSCQSPGQRGGREPVSLRLSHPGLFMFAAGPEVYKCPAELEPIRQNYLKASANVAVLSSALDITKKFQAVAHNLSVAATPAPSISVALLELQSIAVKHDGAPGSTRWRFDIFLNGSKVGTISQYKFAAGDKTVSVNTPDGVQWSPVPIPTAEKLDIRILGFRSNSTVPALGDTQVAGNKPIGDVKIEVNDKIALLGSFVFTLSINSIKK